MNLVTLACAGGFLDVVKILLSNEADINLGQSTPLMEAAQEGHIELVQFLIENGRNHLIRTKIAILISQVPMWFKRLVLEIQVMETN